MRAVLKEILISLPKTASTVRATIPKAPLPTLSTTKHQSPSTAGIDSDGVLMLSLEPVNRPPVHSFVTFRADIGVATVETEGDIVPRMIVWMPQVV